MFLFLAFTIPVPEQASRNAMAPISLKTGFLVLLLSQLHLAGAAVVVPRQQVTCEFEITASSGDTCQSFADDWGVVLAGI